MGLGRAPTSSLCATCGPVSYTHLQEEENSQIVQAVRSLKLTPAQLMAFLNDPKNSLTTSGHTDPKPEAPEKEDTAHEEN